MPETLARRTNERTLLMSGDLTYRGIRLIIPSAADITANFFWRHKPLVQEALDVLAETEDSDGDASWNRRNPPVFTLEGLGPEDQLRTNVVELRPRERVMWAVHKDHTARRPGLSPFVTRRDWPMVDSMTIELDGTAKEPRLVRVYAGGYRPPLPWMNSVRDAEGGRPASVEYWRHHAYIRVSSLMVRHTRTAPAWF